MGPQRILIVNADDFGLSPGVNRGIVEAHERGIVTSASLMVRWPAAPAAADYARAHPELSLGLHLDLGEWAFRDGQWVALYHVVTLDDPSAVQAEVIRQVQAFRRLLGRNPTHLDSHQHVHRSEPLRSIARRMADELAVPLRHFDAAIHHCGNFYGQSEDGTPWPEGITTDALVKLACASPAGVTELGCHPAAEEDIDTMYRAERLQELRTLCEPAVRKSLDAAGIRLASFQELPPRDATESGALQEQQRQEDPA